MLGTRLSQLKRKTSYLQRNGSVVQQTSGYGTRSLSRLGSKKRKEGQWMQQWQQWAGGASAA